MEDQFNRNLGEASGSWALGERLDLSKEPPTQPRRCGHEDGNGYEILRWRDKNNGLKFIDKMMLMVGSPLSMEAGVKRNT